MTRMTTLKLALAVVGILIWLFGNQAGDDRIRWIGIGLLVVAVLLRFVGRKL
jgi:hypothetical protein